MTGKSQENLLSVDSQEERNRLLLANPLNYNQRLNSMKGSAKITPTSNSRQY